MSEARHVFRRVKTAISALVIGAALGVHPSHAVEFTAGIVATEMDEADRYPFLAGVVEGLAYARYKKDGDETEGMRCIYEWFYENESRPQEILATFREFADYTPGAVVAAMLVKECGS